MPKYTQDKDGWFHPVSRNEVSSPEFTKLILRPNGGLNLAAFNPRGLHKELTLRAELTPNEAANAAVSIDPVKNLAFISCNDPTAAKKFEACQKIATEKGFYDVKIHAATARETCRGVIHNVEPRTESATLMKYLKAPGFEILAARMMGSTSTAIITFTGTYIPIEVNYDGGIYRCRPHRPRAQYCTKCLAIGHRADVCTKVTDPLCPKCGSAKKDDADHTCITKCANCGGPHSADDNSCEVRHAADRAVRYQAYQKRIATRAMMDKTQQPSTAQEGPPTTTAQKEERSKPEQQAPRKQPSTQPSHQGLAQGKLSPKQQRQSEKRVSQPLSKYPTRITNTKLAQKTYRDALRSRSSHHANHTPTEHFVGPLVKTTPEIETTDMESEGITASETETNDMEAETSHPDNHAPCHPPLSKRSRTSGDSYHAADEANQSIELQVLRQRIHEMEMRIEQLTNALEQKFEEKITKQSTTILERVAEQYAPICSLLTKIAQHLNIAVDEDGAQP